MSATRLPVPPARTAIDCPTPPPILPRPGFSHRELAAIQVPAIQGLDGIMGCLVTVDISTNHAGRSLYRPVIRLADSAMPYRGMSSCSLSAVTL